VKRDLGENDWEGCAFSAVGSEGTGVKKYVSIRVDAGGSVFYTYGRWYILVVVPVVVDQSGVLAH
jgi:hypothetical protein